MKINYETNDIEEISIAKISNETEESRKEKQHLLMFSGALGHVQVHQIFTHPVLDKVDNQYTIKLKNYICTANYGHTLKSAKGLKITPEQKVGICYDLVRGLEYTHLKGIVHNNIDLNSILVQEIKLHRLPQDTEDSKMYHVALSHWRKAYTPYGPKTIREQFYGSVENTAPELIAKNIRFIDKTSLSRECAHDVYALGKTLLTFLLNIEIDSLKRLPLYSDRSTTFNEFIQCSTLGERIKWYKSVSKSLNSTTDQLVKKNMGQHFSAVYKSAKNYINSSALSTQNSIVKQALSYIVEMINPDPTQRPKASNIAQHLSGLLSN